MNRYRKGSIWLLALAVGIAVVAVMSFSFMRGPEAPASEGNKEFSYSALTPEGHFGFLEWTVVKPTGRVEGSYTDIRTSDYGDVGDLPSVARETVKLTGKLKGDEVWFSGLEEGGTRVEGTWVNGEIRDHTLGPDTAGWRPSTAAQFETDVEKWRKAHPLKPCPTAPYTACDE